MGEDERQAQIFRELSGAKSLADLKSISPPAHSGQADAPILLVYGVDDADVLASESIAMHRVLSRQENQANLFCSNMLI
jgi:dipeptidyl aminopeptidase/acylaminoacyl peptidase